MQSITKAKALELVMLLQRGVTLTAPQLESLALYFSPPVPKKPKTAWQWVALASDHKRKDTREFLHYLNAQDGVLFGADGKRLHWCATELANGAYCPKTLRYLGDNVVAPDMRKLWAQPSRNGAPALQDLPRRVVNHGLQVVDFEKKAFYLDQLQFAYTAPVHALELSKDRGRIIGAGEFGGFVVMAAGAICDA